MRGYHEKMIAPDLYAKLTDTIAHLEDCLNSLSPPEPTELLDFEYDLSDDITYEDRDVLDMFGNKTFRQIDCSFVRQGLYFAPFDWMRPYASLYYCGAMLRCYLVEVLSGNNQGDLHDIPLFNIARWLQRESLTSFQATPLKIFIRPACRRSASYLIPVWFPHPRASDRHSTGFEN